MVPISLKAVGQLAAASLPLLATPALAAQPEGPSAVSALGLSGEQLSLTELSRIRGGFDLNNSLSINFAFQQIEAINGIVVKSIMVPETNVTAATPSFTTPFAASTQPSTLATTVPSAATSTATSTTSPAVLVTDAAGNTQTVAPSASGAINLTTTANSGLTAITTQFGASGLSNTTMNQANNTAVSVAATMNISISGMSQFLTQQQSFANAQSGLYYAGSAFK